MVMKKSMSRLYVMILLLFLVGCGGDDRGEQADQADQADLGEQVDRDAVQGAGPTAGATPRMEAGTQVIEIEATSSGFQPAQVVLQQGVPARLVFTRTSEASCSEQVEVPEFGVQRTELPLNEPVALEFTPDEEGSFEFVCGMDMQSGTILVRNQV